MLTAVPVRFRNRSASSSDETGYNRGFEGVLARERRENSLVVVVVSGVENTLAGERPGENRSSKPESDEQVEQVANSVLACHRAHVMGRHPRTRVIIFRPGVCRVDRQLAGLPRVQGPIGPPMPRAHQAVLRPTATAGPFPGLSHGVQYVAGRRGIGRRGGLSGLQSLRTDGFRRRAGLRVYLRTG